MSENVNPFAFDFGVLNVASAPTHDPLGVENGILTHAVSSEDTFDMLYKISRF
jgi:hypothetical protein